ncbi:DivIVA domain-containing protein [Jeotgalibaca porci]|uniref:DivIVA domain-containing protein n=1 Tax=Jeotgalibaca porci TaxID=1868793 RepID=UPI00359FB60E
MAITPLDIQHKEFDAKMRGYDKEQVDDFLDQVKHEFELLLKDQKDAEKNLKFAEEKLQHFETLQDALNKSIVVAQDAADRLKENARKEAEIILFEAEKSADKLLKKAAEKAADINRETANVRRESRNFRQKLQLMVETQMNLINNEEWDILLNTTPEKDIHTPTLDEVLMNRTHKVDDLAKASNFDTEVTEDEDEGQVEAIDISTETK